VLDETGKIRLGANFRSEHPCAPELALYFLDHCGRHGHENSYGNLPHNLRHVAEFGKG
jgi:hypothetical protein